MSGSQPRPGSHSGRGRAGKGSHHRFAQSDEDRFPYGRCGRHVHGGTGSARRRLCRAGVRGRRAEGARGLRPRGRADRDVHAGRRRHLHQGRRRRRRPGRQGREGHSGGRSAQCRDHRRQRGRQRRRLRGHGGRPLRVVRRDAGGRADPRVRGVRQRGPGLPAARPRDRCDHRDDRHLRGGAPARRPQRHERDQPRVLHLRGDLARPRRDRHIRLPAVVVRRPRRGDRRGGAGQERRSAGPRTGRGGHRHRARRADPAAHRLLHRDHPAPGTGHREDLADRTGHRGPRRSLRGSGIGRLHRPADRPRRVRGVPAGRHVDHAGAVRGGAGAPVCSPRSV